MVALKLTSSESQGQEEAAHVRAQPT